MLKMICFDMDGTIADLYGVPNWLKLLRAEDTTPYEQAQPMWDMDFLVDILDMLRMVGVEIRITTWLSMDSSEDYKERTRVAKKEWLNGFDFPYDHFHGVQYGTTKANCVRQYLEEDEEAILIDDSDKVRKGWNLGQTINPKEENICEVLLGILAEILTN